MTTITDALHRLRELRDKWAAMWPYTTDRGQALTLKSCTEQLDAVLATVQGDERCLACGASLTSSLTVRHLRDHPVCPTCGAVTSLATVREAPQEPPAIREQLESYARYLGYANYAALHAAAFGAEGRAPEPPK